MLIISPPFSFTFQQIREFNTETIRRPVQCIHTEYRGLGFTATAVQSDERDQYRIRDITKCIQEIIVLSQLQLN